MDIVVNGIVLKCQNYKDNDIIITLFTAEIGKLSAVLKGVRSAKAKLKFAGQLFCFGQWCLAEKAGRFTVTSVSAENLFYELTQDYDRYSYACVMLQLCDLIVKPNIISSQLLVCLLKALKLLTFDDINEKLVMLKFMLQLSKLEGYGFAWNKCGNCGVNLIGNIEYSMNLHAFTCPSCAGFGGIEVSRACYTNMKIIDNTDFDKLTTINAKSDMLDSCINLMQIHIENVVGVKISALD